MKTKNIIQAEDNGVINRPVIHNEIKTEARCTAFWTSLIVGVVSSLLASIIFNYCVENTFCRGRDIGKEVIEEFPQQEQQRGNDIEFSGVRI